MKIEYSTAYSQTVTHPSTNKAQHCLTRLIERVLVWPYTRDIATIYFLELDQPFIEISYLKCNGHREFKVPKKKNKNVNFRQRCHVGPVTVFCTKCWKHL